MTTATGLWIAIGVCVVALLIFWAGWTARGWEWPPQKETREQMFRSMDQENQSLRRELTKALNRLNPTNADFRVIHKPGDFKDDDWKGGEIVLSPDPLADTLPLRKDA